jgi:hypothetical protein
MAAAGRSKPPNGNGAAVSVGATPTGAFYAARRSGGAALAATARGQRAVGRLGTYTFCRRDALLLLCSCATPSESRKSSRQIVASRGLVRPPDSARALSTTRISGYAIERGRQAPRQHPSTQHKMQQLARNAAQASGTARRPVTVRAVETQAPHAVTNGKGRVKVRPRPESLGIWRGRPQGSPLRAVRRPDVQSVPPGARAAQPGVPQGTPVVETLVRRPAGAAAPRASRFGLGERRAWRTRGRG